MNETKTLLVKVQPFDIPKGKAAGGVKACVKGKNCFFVNATYAWHSLHMHACTVRRLAFSKAMMLSCVPSDFTNHNEE